MKNKARTYFILTTAIVAVGVPAMLHAQQGADSLLQQATLENVIQYAIKKQPAIQQALIDEKITESTIKTKIADWYPQLNFNYNYQHNFKVQTSIIGGNPVRLGVENTSSAQFLVSQNIFNRDALLASRTAGVVKSLARQNTSSVKIDVAVDVTKAFYDVLATTQQIKVAREDINRLERSLKDAYNRYTAGITDKTDYKRATIALNNTKAQLRSNEELLEAKIEYLKTLMGYPVNAQLDIQYDTLQMEREIAVDTLQTIDYNKRIEYQQLFTRKKIQEANLSYNKWSFLPAVSANGAYNFNYLNNEVGKLYSQNFPNSYAGLTLSFPIFQGGKRKYNIDIAEFQLKRIDFDLLNLQNNINAEYARAIATYKSSLISFNTIKENLDLAREVYDVINLQYRSGVKTYLEVISAETDLRTARINYFNALYQVLAGKTDVQRALGLINY